RHAPQTVNRRLAALRSFLAWCEGQGWVVEPQTPKSVRQARPGPQWLSVKEERALYRAVAAAGNKRDVAIVQTLAKAGLRVGELVALEGRDILITPRKGTIVVRKGKGSKQREVPLHAEGRAALQALGPVGPWERVFQGQRGPLTKSGVQKL